MTVIEQEAKSLLLKHKRIDSWFVSRYGMNVFRGCAHNCAFCDGRAERYRVAGEFGRDVVVKTNAADLLRRELDPARRRIPLKRSYICLGGGVGDAYQPAEERYAATRRVLEVIEDLGWPVHVLTRSSLVERDLDILERINQNDRAIVSMSFSSVDDRMCALFEPCSTPPSRRLETLAVMKERGIATGMFLLPVIPYLTDTPEMIDRTVAGAGQAGVDFVLFGGMTLKPGRQKDHFLDVLRRAHPDLAPRVERLYGDRIHNPDHESEITQRFSRAARKEKLPPRVPARLFEDILDENDLVVVLLENIDYLARLNNRPSPYRFAAHSVSQLKESLSSTRTRLRDLKGVGKTTERIIEEILDTRKSSYHESLLAPYR